MPKTGTYTVRDIIDAAYGKIGVKAQDTEVTAYEADVAMTALNMMLKAWQNEGYNLFNYAEQSVTLTTAASYTLDPVRPIRILEARLRRSSGIDLPMQRMTREEYFTLPNKGSTGTPTNFYYDRQREAALLYVWPVLAAANGETLRITYEDEFEDVTSLSAETEVPGEWWEATVYNLAARLLDDFPVNGVAVDRVLGRAQLSLSQALAADREDSVFFGCGHGYD